MNIAFIRGGYLNNYELQSYLPLISEKVRLTGFSSLKPMHKVPIPVKKLISPVDLPDFPKKLPILNRLCLGDAMYLYGLEKSLKGFDIAHGRETYFHFSSQVINAKKMGYVKKVLVTCSETIPFNHETISGRKRLKRKVRNGADHFHCLTEKAKQALVTEGVDPQKITVIHYGVDLNTFYPERNIPTRKNVTFLYVGRLEDQKGVPELIHAWQRLKSCRPTAVLKVIGKGPLHKDIENLGVTPVTLPYRDIPTAMRQADVLVLPSKPTRFWEEYLGMVLLEAMACGLPVISTKSGAIPEIVDDSAYLIQPGNTDELHHAMEDVADNAEKRATIRQKGLQRVKKFFDAEKQSKKLAGLYQKVFNL